MKRLPETLLAPQFLHSKKVQVAFFMFVEGADGCCLAIWIE
ncbi:hypothetical protein HMPREF9371_0469 [Neisseria shayeganii 871]|uniref:Uncharacterized protein n=1 Tax=Neisseria shayeganii 871 TaxID=1032488 RepID=G4CFT0_9NEIS|nr:hypothetical protein HMPREF9371_0469 [Neisseria shayeganii 871]